MTQPQPNEIYLKDYQVPAYLIETTALRFELGEEVTRVIADLKVSRNPECQQSKPGLQLDGHPDLVLEELSVDGRCLSAEEYQRDGEQLIIADVPASFELHCVTVIEPQNNTALEGLYKSDGMFCTQCEAEGFRRITFYPDRPDVMSVFETTVVADKAAYPVLLSNGNAVERGEEGMFTGYAGRTLSLSLLICLRWWPVT